jgi:hypothetical protein
MRSLSKNIVNFYVMRVDGSQVVFLLDDLNPADEPAKIGQIYEEPESINLPGYCIDFVTP